ncbi:hypothetical protein [Sinorhizobium americanum]|uniref:Uncharacterized protein n=1 Tax=Sinorhizobium americanum TaxID=194963 RepID=A0A4R2BWB6_9HYPH|nr:hypothetical protein [Sinorhizobium americanum]TCN30344.1 hypothetical protein EV184_108218 [Sinorhizobium americanum]
MGHPPAAVWAYTPRQIAGFLHFASIRIRKERAAELATGFNAARGKPQDVKTQIKDLQKD